MYHSLGTYSIIGANFGRDEAAMFRSWCEETTGKHTGIVADFIRSRMIVS